MERRGRGSNSSENLLLLSESFAGLLAIIAAGQQDVKRVALTAGVSVVANTGREFIRQRRLGRENKPSYKNPISRK